MKVTIKRLEKLGFMYGTRSVIKNDEPMKTQHFLWYTGVNIDIQHDFQGFKIWKKDEQIGLLLGHVKISTIKDIIKQTES